MNLNEVKKNLQQHLSDGLVAVIGSGLSCAEGLPGMGELANHLVTTVGPGLEVSDLTVWAEITPLITEHGLEAALLARPPTSALESAIASATGQLVGDREKSVIMDVFSGSRVLRLTRLIRHLLKPPSGLPIVTTNYDRLVEVAVEEAGLGVDTMFVGHFAGTLNERESKLSFCRDVKYKKPNFTYHYRPRAVVFKPHGSLSWYLRGGRPVFYAGDLPGVARLIITPGHNKFRNGYDSPFDQHRSRANEAIDRASRFLILGYGFNDDHLETHLSPAIRSGKPTLMMTHSLSTKAENLAMSNHNVIALASEKKAGVEGTRVILDKVEYFFSGISLWDVNSFVTEVLEP